MNSIERAQQLRQQLEQQLLPLIDHDYVLYGLPYYFNIGDTLIWEGMLQILKKCPFHCIDVCGWNDYPRKKIADDTIILIEGGGYFGDDWRFGWENVLTELSLNKSNKIILLPNSVSYNDTRLLEHDVKMFSQMERLTICLRDQPSFDFVRQHFSNDALLTPDAAFGISPEYLSQWTKPADKSCLFLKRDDREFVGGEYAVPAEADVSDWITMEAPSPVEKLITKLTSHYHHRLGGRMMHWALTKNIYNKMYYHVYRKQMTSRGVRQLSSYQTIYTTRLHGMILAALLGKQTYFFNNSNGKIRNLYDTWLRDADNIHVAE